MKRLGRSHAPVVIGLVALLLFCLPVSAAAAPLTVLATCAAYLPKNDANMTATLFVTNVGAAATSITLALTGPAGPAGNLVAQNVPAGGTHAFELASAALPDGVYSGRLAASGPVVATAHVRDAQKGSVAAYTAQDCNSLANDNTVVAAQSSGTATDIVVANMGAGAVTAKAEIPGLLQAIDIPLPPGAARRLTAADLQLATPGMARVRIYGPAGSMLQVLTVERALAGTLLIEPSLYSEAVADAGAAVAASRQFIPLARGRGDSDATSGIMIYNPEASTATVAIMAFNADGSINGTVLSDTLPPGVAKTYRPLSFIDITPDPLSLVVSSDKRVSATVRTLPANGSSPNVDSVTTDSSGGSTMQFLSGVIKQPNLYANLAIQNAGTGPANLTVRFLSVSGQIAHQVDAAVMPGAAKSLNLNTLAALPTGFAGSVMATANQPVVMQMEMVTIRNVPMTSVTITGPAVAALGESVTFTATVQPENATPPLVFAWGATDLPPVEHGVSSNVDTIARTWNSTGVKSVSVQVNSSAGPVNHTHQVAVADALVGGGEPITTTAQVGLGGPISASVQAPPGALGAGDSLAISAVEIPAQEVAAAAVGHDEPHALQVDLYSGGAIVPGAVFTKPVQLTFLYTDGLVLGLDEGTLRVLAQTAAGRGDATATCASATTYVRAPSVNTITIGVCRPGTYWLDTASERQFLPSILRPQS